MDCQLPHYFVLAPNGGQHELDRGTLDENAGNVANVKNGFTGAEIVDHPVLSENELELFYWKAGKMLHAVRPDTGSQFIAGSGAPVMGLFHPRDDGREADLALAERLDLYYFALAAATPTALYKTSRAH